MEASNTYREAFPKKLPAKEIFRAIFASFAYGQARLPSASAYATEDFTFFCEMRITNLAF
jgi:hypothetical protein